ncbi:hypothetical protein [Methanoregula boonei]|jgi:hypothetical protein|nr:hypothetical protein [Methanoregula boonei]
MISRVDVHIPFDILSPVNEDYQIYSIERSGYNIDFLPLSRNADFATKKDPVIAKLDDRDAILCNTVTMIFHKDAFNRNITASLKLDPPLDVIEFALNFFLMRLKWVIQSPQIHPVSLFSTFSKIQYLNDDGSVLHEENGKFRTKFLELYNINSPAINKEIWNDSFSYSSDYFEIVGTLGWEYLLLDAIDELPQIGPSIVLANVGLEVFISGLLNKLAGKQSQISIDFWKWISIRNDKLELQPSVKDQYDILLKVFTGHSLKEENELWKGFSELRNVRNQFVHEGVARLNSSSPPLTEQQARDLLQKAIDIPRKINTWIPESLRGESHKNYVMKRQLLWQTPLPK